MKGFTELDCYLFGQATHYDIYKKMGAHRVISEGTEGIRFTVWAPHASRVFVIGEFNGWNEQADELHRVDPAAAGVFECFCPDAFVNSLYKYLIITSDGRKLYKADPYANYCEFRPGTASRIADIEQFAWTDHKWMERRASETSMQHRPLSIYEVHPGSWMRHPGKEEEGYYSYRELAVRLSEYVLNMGYTHIELMGIAEYPYDGSWGYQVTGYYAPTSRFGSPEEFAEFVDHMHAHGIGVILDWVPAHFPRDAHGLAEFDGTLLYEYPDPRMGEHPEWGTKIFNYGHNPVKNFLIGSALMWIEHYHIDGLRVDAVASMLYLDYGKNPGDWVPNRYGENKNLEAIEFFRHINTLIPGRNPGVIMIAEESTTWSQVTGSAASGGLNFDFKWNMGWMHDFLDYMKMDPYFRSYEHNKMTFAMSYNETENYILVLSHDEVVHLKKSMIEKMPGSGKEKFANLKAGYAFMMGHPGKKLLFMGQDFGQIHEWDEKTELEWYLLGNDDHRQLQEFVRALLHLYRAYPSMYELDREREGFEWINADDRYRSIYSFIRRSMDGRNSLLFVINFTPVEHPDYCVGVPVSGNYELVLTTTNPLFGGSGTGKKKTITAKNRECDGRAVSIAYPLAAYEAAVFRF